MSLNGLDDVVVTQAYQGALAEAGGWFLLKYASRDAVQVLTRGTGGAGEVRAAVAQYDEKSPLYGFMLYRRRKVLIKYIPDGTSRLLQARVAVHFITITDKFAPHDIALSITSPDELSDAALTAACTLHTAAPSSSSSSGSSRHQKLSWIQESAEEGSNAGGEDGSGAARPTTAASAIPTILEPVATIDEEPAARQVSVISDGAMTVPIILEEKHEEETPAEKKDTDSATTRVAIEPIAEAPVTSESDLADLQTTLKSYDKLFEGGPEPRASSQTARPNYDELYEHYYAQYSKPKVKLGPRPRPSLEGKRPSTSGSGSNSLHRPKSSLPAGLRSATKKAAEARAAKPKDISVVPSLALPPPPPIPMTPEAPTSPMSLTFTARSPASVRSMPVSSYSSHRSTGMTQEKSRLMKALEMRKKQMKAQVEKREKMAEEAAAQPEEKPESESEEKPEQTLETADAKDKEDSQEKLAPEEKSDKKEDGGEQKSFEDEVSTSLGLESSGLVFASSLADSDDLHSTASVSSPISAQTQGSSCAPSTRPSSISEDENSASDQQAKSENSQDPESPDFVDEEQSVDSTPTIVPESRTPIPSLIHHSPKPSEAEAKSIGDDLDEPREEPTVYALPVLPDESRSRRKSKRESMLFVPSGDKATTDDTQMKKRNRESVILPTSKRQSWYETKERRRAMLDPLHVSAENSEAEYLSDDSFMEELQSATVQEAMPMSVSKSPITPWFPRKNSDNDNGTGRSVSSAYAKSFRSSPEQLQRKTSGPWPPHFQSDMPVVAKKITVSSGISQRIKALAEKSNREASPPASSHGLETPSSTLAQRKSSFFATTPTETSPNNSKPTGRLGTQSFLTSKPSTPEKKPVQVKPIKATVYNVQRAHEQPESVQVTARIVRDDRVTKPTLTMPTEATPLDLHQSPLIIDHQKPTWRARSPSRAHAEPTSPKAPSTSHSREQSLGPSSRTSSDSTWRTFGRRMSESKSIHSHDGDERRDDKKDKKESRTSKMFKRMSSSISSMPWKNSGSNLNLPEQDMRSTSLASLREPPPPVHVGDLNIQFPDTLLWKRRYVEIDTLGNLVLSPSRSNEKGVVKRFHLSEFRTPYPPDLDRQELPNSVVLDFVDGRTLQVACETYVAQAQVLQILREAHDAWLAYSQSV